MQLQAQTARSVLRPVRKRRLVRTAMILLSVFLLGGLFAAAPYALSAVQRLQPVAPAMNTFDHSAATSWWAEDESHIADLVQKWPLSIPTLIGETAVLWIEEQKLVRTGSLKSESGFTIVPSGTAGQIHMLSGSVRSRLQALFRQWTPDVSNSERTHYAGYPLSEMDGTPVTPEEVQEILDSVILPDAVFDGLTVVLLPFVLHETAGLGTEGQAILGAAPSSSGKVNPNRTAYTLFHEIGHHVHFTYLDSRTPELWATYMELRGIETWTPSGAVGTETWSRSAQETFAEDFRLLFGPPAARAIPHGTKYGDPLAAPDRGEGIRTFIIDLVSK